LIDPDALLVVDASTIINLNATGCSEAILRALPNRVVAVDIVPGEMQLGRGRGHQDADQLDALIAGGFVAIVELDDDAERCFETLVVGSAAMTLDDGEAATIAYAAAAGGTAVIDEKKANRICRERFPQLRQASTVDIFAQPNVEPALGRAVLAQAVVNALQLARMRVLPHHLEWVIGLIGAEQAQRCASLPKSVRQSRR
jgi:predicted nucleic acid-binding protein